MKDKFSKYPKEITDSWYKKFGKKINVDPIALKAFVMTYGQGEDSKTNHRFEPMWFKHYSKMGGEVSFEMALDIDESSAKFSTAWGIGGVMGHDYEDAGYVSVDVMIMLFNESKVEQLLGLVNVIGKRIRLNNALSDMNWAKVEYYSRGIGYHDKSVELNQVYNQLKDSNG